MSAATMPTPSSANAAAARPLMAQPYLSFEGRCEEALNFYRDALGAEITAMMRFSDAPPMGDGEQPGCAGGPMTPPPGNKVMHSSFKLGQTEIMATDGMCNAAGAGFKGIALTITYADEATATRAFNNLAAGGKVNMPLGPTFFAKTFGVVDDKFGVGWMVIVPAEIA